MAIKEIHYNDIGTVFEVTMTDETDGIVDLTNATTMQILFLKPDDDEGRKYSGPPIVKTAVHTNTGSDGKMQYVTVDGDLDTTGKWYLQGRVVLPAWEGSSDILNFKVYPNLDYGF